MSILKDENGRELIGHVDVGGIAIPFGKLAQTVPDVERFMRCLSDAQKIGAAMDEDGGAVPEYARDWPESKLTDVAATLQDISQIQGSAVVTLRDEAARRSE